MKKDDYVAPPGSRNTDYVAPPKNNDYVVPPESKENDYVAPPKGNDYVAPPKNNEYVIPKQKTEDNKGKTFIQKDFSEIKNNHSQNNNDYSNYSSGVGYKPSFMDKFKNIFYSLNSDWLKRHYIFSVMVFLFMVFVVPKTPGTSIVFYISCALLYPFAMFIYENTRNFILGDTVIFLPLKNLFLWKVFKVMFIWCFSVIIGPIGLIYLYFKVNK